MSLVPAVSQQKGRKKRIVRCRTYGLLVAAAALAVLMASGTVALAATIECSGGYCVGTEEADTMSGSDTADEMHGLGGPDSLFGRDGDDVSLQGGRGNDTLKGGKGNDGLAGYFGNDRLYGGLGDDEMRGDDDWDYPNRTDGQDRLYGGEGNDSLWGYYGDDALFGGDGNDFINAFDDERFTGGEDIVDCGKGHDVVIFDKGVDKVDKNCEVRI